MSIENSQSPLLSSAQSNLPRKSRRGPAGVLIAASVIAGIAVLGWALAELSTRRRRAMRQTHNDVGRWEGEGGSASESAEEPGEL